LLNPFLLKSNTWLLIVNTRKFLLLSVWVIFLCTASNIDWLYIDFIYFFFDLSACLSRIMLHYL
jgi:hypothetical protein